MSKMLLNRFVIGSVVAEMDGEIFYVHWCKFIRAHHTHTLTHFKSKRFSSPQFSPRPLSSIGCEFFLVDVSKNKNF